MSWEFKNEDMDRQYSGMANVVLCDDGTVRIVPDSEDAGERPQFIGVCAMSDPVDPTLVTVNVPSTECINERILDDVIEYAAERLSVSERDDFLRMLISYFPQSGSMHKRYELVCTGCRRREFVMSGTFELGSASCSMCGSHFVECNIMGDPTH